MGNQSFRAAFWALLLALALSICALCSNPEQVRLALLTPSSPGGSDVPETLLADHTGSAVPAIAATTDDALPVGASEPWDGDLIHEHSLDSPAESFQPPFLAMDESATSTAPDLVDPHHAPSLPVREATSNSGVEFPWLVHSPSGSTSADVRYEELPAPPEFNEPQAPESTELAQAAVSQLETLTARIDELRSQIEQLQAAQLSVEASLQTLTAPPQPPPKIEDTDEIELLTWVVELDESALREKGLI
jgi:hypothetical protein